mmetsp:Transcript_81808/g.231876  ORF Transcript_81808/g.231876 Transcript_81808/m.231876 type:complete len:208 (+) Transcript_81808:366-989(+)
MVKALHRWHPEARQRSPRPLLGAIDVAIDMLGDGGHGRWPDREMPAARALHRRRPEARRRPSQLLHVVVAAVDVPEDGGHGRGPHKEVPVVEALHHQHLEARHLLRARVDVPHGQHAVLAHEDDRRVSRQHLGEEDAVGPEEVPHQGPGDPELPGTEELHHQPHHRPGLPVQEVDAHVRQVKEERHGVDQDAARDFARVLPDEPCHR